MQQGRSVELHLTYGPEGAVSGTGSIPTPAGEQRAVAIDTVLSAGVLDDNMIQALMAAVQLSDGSEYLVPAFDGTEGTVTSYALSASDGGSVTVAAGTFDTWKVDVTGWQFPQVYYVSKDSPRKVVKIEWVGTPVVFELAGSTP
jgi:hypothetical protein